MTTRFWTLLTTAICVAGTTAAAFSQTKDAREAFAKEYQRTGAMMGGACTKVVMYGSGDSFGLHCPGIRKEIAQSIMHDPNAPIVRELKSRGFKYFSITPAGGDLPEVKLVP